MDQINGQILKDMLKSGMNNLNNHSGEIDALNVFPVPDGDTGTNMSLTFTNGVKSAIEIQEDHVGKIFKALSRGLLMGARGNSGVITSQIFRGIYQALEENETIDALQLAHAFVNGSRVAYRAVMRPVEGTILTVIREAADYTYAYTVTEEVSDCSDVLRKMIKEANESLNRTPELLPVLAEVGVVDSGGKGLCVIFEGFLAALEGHAIEKEESEQVVDQAQTKVTNDGEGEYGFCTEFVIQLSENGIKNFSEEGFRDELAAIGNSLVCVQDEDLVKVHVHTLEPYTALKMGRRKGKFVKIKVENMQQQHDHIVELEDAKEAVEEPAEHKKYAIITVAPGKGVDAMFKDLRADVVIGGGQTMNPSTEDFVSAIDKLNADTIFILPNNSNIILAANQAKEVCENQDIEVLATKTIPQGLSACIMFNPDVDKETNLSEMNEAIANVKSGEVTYAIKDTTYEGQEIKKGEYMGICGKKIAASVPDCMEASKSLVSSMLDDESELVTLIYGADATEDQAKELASYIEENSDAEVEIYNGQQPVYSFIIGVE